MYFYSFLYPMPFQLNSLRAFPNFRKQIPHLLLCHNTSRKQLWSLFLYFLYVLLIKTYFLLICWRTYRWLIDILVSHHVHLLPQLLVLLLYDVQVHLVTVFQKDCEATVLFKESVFLCLDFLQLWTAFGIGVFEMIILLLNSAFPEMLRVHHTISEPFLESLDFLLEPTVFDSECLCITSLTFLS